ncbi:MAG: chemotaxis-specific protein-glutamate methyltransferase CheB [Mariprofundus sp.]|nr:chemotaxis-specific protein-glutamate methyltransferase CheB [Mariprofundus sp.]
MAKSLRVLIIDASIVFRTLLRTSLKKIDGVEVIGAAGDGEGALRQIQALQPDLITLDMEDAQLDGAAVLRLIRTLPRTVMVLIISTDRKENADCVLEALALGAYEVLLKPDASAHQAFSEKLQTCVKTLMVKGAVGDLPALAKSRISSVKPAKQVISAPHADAALRQMSARENFHTDIIAIGSSTGGPQALSCLFKGLPEAIDVPIVITQHMPKSFVQSLASRLDRESLLNFHVAEQGMALQPGHVYLAPGELHMHIKGTAAALQVDLVDGAKVHQCKPAVDPMFFSLEKLAPRVRSVAVVLTGMGQDGAAGAKAIADAGGVVIVQDRVTSTVWGMPGSTFKAGAAHFLLPIEEVPTTLSLFSSGRAVLVEQDTL